MVEQVIQSRESIESNSMEEQRTEFKVKEEKYHVSSRKKFCWALLVLVSGVLSVAWGMLSKSLVGIVPAQNTFNKTSIFRQRVESDILQIKESVKLLDSRMQVAEETISAAATAPKEEVKSHETGLVKKRSPEVKAAGEDASVKLPDSRMHVPEEKISAEASKAKEEAKLDEAGLMEKNTQKNGPEASECSWPGKGRAVSPKKVDVAVGLHVCPRGTRSLEGSDRVMSGLLQKYSNEDLSAAGCLDLPVPFAEGMKKVYAPKATAKGFQKADDKLISFASVRLREMLTTVAKNPAKYCGAISRLMQDGLKTNHFGVDFTDVVQKRGLSWNMDDDIKLALEMYWSEGWQQWADKYSVVAVDYEMRYRPRDMNMFVYAPRNKLSDFYRDGYVQITDFGVDISKLKEEIRVAKQAATWEDLLNSDTRWSRNMHFHSLEPLMENKAILELIGYYFGSDVFINGYQYWHADKHATKDRVTTGEWHHDSCGTRAKIFVYLHEVDEDRMPTEIAAGSQTHLKYTFGGYTIFNNEAVNEAWKVDRMYGPAGGGFIFDPNTIHRSYMDKPHLPRDVVVIDISSSVKSDLLMPASRPPCPRANWRTETVNAEFKYPERTHGPVTSDFVKQDNGTRGWNVHYSHLRAKMSQQEYEAMLDETDNGVANHGGKAKPRKIR